MAEEFKVDDIAEPMVGAQVGAGMLNTHAKGECSGQWCVIHNPSHHHMRDWPLNWRSDRNMMERTCACGIGHPDPDDLAHKARIGDDDAGVHGCCGHCSPPTPSDPRPGRDKENG